MSQARFGPSNIVEEVRDNSSFENAMDYDNGIDNVLANGEPAVSAGGRRLEQADQILRPN
ncbi:MAG: hypothetical protein GWP47_01435 [Actinobacteria bacterium]|nr:hypothetical protein [Actinomycetota bacterium]NCG39343.1 hypothetical protein [Actinomycetota bacterium]